MARMFSWRLAATTVLALSPLCQPSLAAQSELPLVLKEDFENGMDRWETTDPEGAASVWKIIEVGRPGDHALRVTGPSKYEPPYRSPLSIAWLKDVEVGDFELTVRVQNTNPSGGNHRDLCIFWGKQSPSQFYYVHFGAKPDPHACQIFIVNDAPRTMITVDQAEGTPWDNRWHTLRVTRRGGKMAAYFDDMDTPLMTADDTTFGAGQVGIGTFDDNGNFDNLTLRGELVSDSDSNQQ